MNAAQREWVGLKAASEQVGIPITTIRDWTRLGLIELREHPTGRVVDLHQVRAKAMGPIAMKRPSDLQDRVADGVLEQVPGAPRDSLASILLDLQELARQRTS
jgi:hypothetical protein